MPKLGRIVEGSTSGTHFRDETKRLILETNSSFGRNAIEVDLAYLREIWQVERVKKFLYDNGYLRVDAQELLERLSAEISRQNLGHRPHLRLEKLGVIKDRFEEMPFLGQSHEIEICSLRARIS